MPIKCGNCGANNVVALLKEGKGTPDFTELRIYICKSCLEEFKAKGELPKRKSGYWVPSSKN